jgi:hypothetical protein
MAWYRTPIPFPKPRVRASRVAGGFGAEHVAAGGMDHGCGDRRLASQVTLMS